MCASFVGTPRYGPAVIGRAVFIALGFTEATLSSQNWLSSMPRALHISLSLSTDGFCFPRSQRLTCRSEERRVGKEGRSRWSPSDLKKKEVHTRVMEAQE